MDVTGIALTLALVIAGVVSKSEPQLVCLPHQKDLVIRACQTERAEYYPACVDGAVNNFCPVTNK